MSSVIIEQDLEKLFDKKYVSYQAIIYCTNGECTLDYNGGTHLVKKDNIAFILNSKLINTISTSKDFSCNVMYVDESELRQSGPHNPYIIQGMLAMYSDPVLQLTEDEIELYRLLVLGIQRRLEDTNHRFRADILRTSVHLLVLDLFDFHARIHDTGETSTSSSNIMAKFIAMLDAKEYRVNREVAYYAEKLCVVPKYLSEVSNKVSGHSASYWINRYTSQDISEVLRMNKNTVAEVAKMFHFTSTSYFNRYVKRNLGAYPSELRGA